MLDDCSRAIAGYTVFLGAPSALNLSLALRQAIWRKTDPAWAVHGLPDVLYADHGSDFTSDHLAQVAADLHIELVHSAVARRQGRGKLERQAARAVALEQLGARSALAALDAFLDAQPEEGLATLWYGEYVPSIGQLVYANTATRRPC